MDFQIIKGLFLLFADEPEIEPYQQLILVAMEQISKIIIPNYDPSDTRINFLCAALANYRLQQLKSAHDRPQYTYAGKMESGTKNTALIYAEQLLRDYMQMCEDILTEKPFVFMSFSDGEEKLK